MGSVGNGERPRVLLASASPRRSEMLTSFGIDPIVVPADIDETSLDGEPAGQLVERLAREKAIRSWQTWSSSTLTERAEARDRDSVSGWLVIAADTVVEIDGSVLGKPEGKAEAEPMLMSLSGRAHRVHSGLAVGLAADMHDDLEPLSLTVVTDVMMRNLDTETVRWYVESGEPLDKAGAYGIQGLGSVLVERIEGSYPNVVGLPIAEMDRLCRCVGWPLHRLAAPVGQQGSG